MTKILDILKKTNALISNSHFVLTSGMHSSIYVNKDAMYPYTNYSSEVGKLFAQKFKKFNRKIILGVYTEKTLEKNQIFTRGYEKLVKGKNVLVVEDLTTTGGSVKKVINSIKNHGGKVIAVGVMLNRDPKNVNSKTIGAPFYSLGELITQNYQPNDCPLCKKKIPINTSVGHGKKFLTSKRNQA